MAKAFGYLRVSTGRQATEGESLDSQKAKVKAWCELNGHDLAGVFVEAVSGKKMSNRPQLAKVLDGVCKDRGVLVCYSLSRLARSTRDALDISERLRKAGADLASITEQIDTTGAAGRMVFGILAVLSQFESELTGERVKAIWDFKKGKGEKCGGSMPYGYTVDDGGKLTPVEAEQRVIRLMLDLRAKGCTLRDIAHELQAREIRTKQGRAKWSIKVVSTVLKQAEERRQAKKHAA